MADSNSVTLAWVKETTEGVLPTTTRTGTFSAVATGNKITHAAAGNKFDGLVVGQKFTTVGSAVPANNAELTIVSLDLSLDPQEVVVSGATLVDAADITDIITPPDMESITFVSESFSDVSEFTESESVRSDLNRYNPVVTKRNAGGGFNFEMRDDETIDEFMSAALTSTGFNTETSFTGSITVVNATSKIEIAAASTAFDNTSVGQVLELSGSVTNTQPYYLLEVVSIDTASDPHFITFNEIRGYTLEDEVLAAGTIKGKMLRNGNDCSTYAVQWGFTTNCGIADDLYISYTGQAVDSFNLSTSANALLSGDIAIMGTGAIQDSIPYAGLVTTSTVNPVFNTASDVTIVKDNGLGGTGFLLTDFSISISGRAREINAIGTDYASSHGRNSFAPSLSVSLYYSSKALYDEYKAGTRAFPRLIAVDGNGAKYIFSFPSTTLSDGTFSGGANDADLTLSFGSSIPRLFTDSEGETYTMQVDKITAA